MGINPFYFSLALFGYLVCFVIYLLLPRGVRKLYCGALPKRYEWSAKPRRRRNPVRGRCSPGGGIHMSIFCWFSLVCLTYYIYLYNYRSLSFFYSFHTVFGSTTNWPFRWRPWQHRSFQCSLPQPLQTRKWIHWIESLQSPQQYKPRSTQSLPSLGWWRCLLLRTGKWIHRLGRWQPSRPKSCQCQFHIPWKRRCTLHRHESITWSGSSHCRTRKSRQTQNGPIAIKYRLYHVAYRVAKEKFQWALYQGIEIGEIAFRRVE